jgi:putative nucleotidyltransferase with HDIG domain
MQQQQPEFYSLVKGRAVAMSVALEQRDTLTSQHCKRVAKLAVSLGRRYGLPDRDLRLLEIAAAFHDVGKIGIPDDILKKPGTFTDEDRAIMKTHAEQGQRILHAAGLRDGEPLGLAIRTAWPVRRSRCWRGSSRSPMRTTRWPRPASTAAGGRRQKSLPCSEQNRAGSTILT